MNQKQLAGACIMTGFGGATLDDPRCREDVQILKDLHIKNVILFDIHLPTGGMRNIVNEDQLRELTDDLRNELGDDLVIGIDQEGGEVNRLSLFQDAAICEQLSAKMQGAMSPKQLTATIDPVAKALRESGINLVFAPCVDLSINPDNPVIAAKDRSLGSDPERVVKAASTIIETYHSHNVRCCLKHFPGHGSSTTDTHAGLADITDTYHDGEKLVYKLLIDSMNASQIPGAAVMAGHLINRSIDPSLPASLSPKHTTEILRNQLGFTGCVITDSLDMGAIDNSAQASIQALKAGADIVLDGFNSTNKPDDHPAISIHNAILQALSDGTLEGSQLESSAARRQQLLTQ